MVIYQIIPIIVTTFIYVRICFKLYWLPLVEGEGSEIGRKRREQAIRIVKMLIALLVSYFVLSLPVSLVVNIETFRLGSRNLCNIESHDQLVLLCVFANIVNPFILCYFNKTVKLQALKTFLSRDSDDDDESDKTSSQLKSTDV